MSPFHNFCFADGMLTKWQRFAPNFKLAPYLKKPMGYSYFPKEITPTPKSWVETEANLVFYREHDKVCLFLFVPRLPGWVMVQLEFSI
jgi:hypothetical protein